MHTWLIMSIQFPHSTSPEECEYIISSSSLHATVKDMNQAISGRCKVGVLQRIVVAGIVGIVLDSQSMKAIL